MKSYHSLDEAISDLRTKGYISDFETESFCLYCGDLDMRLDPEEFKVDDIYEIDGKESTDNSTMLYAISSIAGVRGIVVDKRTTCSLKSSIELIKGSQQ